MRRLLLIVAAAVLIALPLAASDTYSFHLKVTDGRSALLANPDFEKLHMSPRQLERAAGDRVMLFDHATGTHWKWMMLSWLDKPLEQGLNTRGAAKPDVNADIGLTPAANGMLHVRCLSARCQVGTVTLSKGESKDFPTDSELELTLQ